MTDAKLRRAKRIIHREIAQSDDDELRYQLRTALQHLVIHEEELVATPAEVDEPHSSLPIEGVSDTGP